MSIQLPSERLVPILEKLAKKSCRNCKGHGRYLNDHGVSRCNCVPDWKVIAAYEKKYGKIDWTPEPLLIEGIAQTCGICHSSMLPGRWFGLLWSKGCIQPECENYHENN